MSFNLAEAVGVLAGAFGGLEGWVAERARNALAAISRCRKCSVDFCTSELKDW
jgi:hypothetical protein